MSAKPTSCQRHLRACAALALLVSAAVAPAMAQPASAAAAAKPAAAADRDFATKAAGGGIAEVEGGKLAQQRASHEQVRQFAAKMVEDHSKANDELKSLAGARNIKLPDAPPADARKHLDMLAKKQGAAFDRAYMDHMVAEHRKTIALFEKEAHGGKDAELKAFAQKTLPVLQGHLKMARDTHAAVATKKPA